MASFAAPDTPKLAASILFIAAVAVSHVVISQPLFEPVARDARQAEIVDSIREEQVRNGAYSAALVEPLTRLSFLYQESGDRGLAIAAIERALQVQRANFGLRTLDQAPLLRQMIENAEMLGDYKMAWDLEQALIALAHKNPEDLRAVPIFREIADERMDLLERYVKGDSFPPQIVLGCFYEYDPVNADESSVRSQGGNCYSGSRRVAIQEILRDAQRYYFDAIRVIQRNELYSSDELRDLEMELIRSSYLHGRIPTETRKFVDGKILTKEILDAMTPEEVGRASLRRLLSYEVANDGSAEARVESLVLMADWDLMFANGRSENDAVLAAYEAAYRELEKAGTSQASIEGIFSPGTPVVIPAFLPNPLASEQTAASAGHIDVAFEIGKYGKSDKIEVVGSTNDVSDATKKELVRAISRSTFRPRVVAGRVAESSSVVVRYYPDN
jgi:hypothetical protein